MSDIKFKPGRYMQEDELTYSSSFPRWWPHWVVRWVIHRRLRQSIKRNFEALKNYKFPDVPADGQAKEP